MSGMVGEHGGASSGAVTISAFARAVGVTRQAVQNAARSGRIRQREDGLIDLAEGMRDWHEGRRAPPITRAAVEAKPTAAQSVPRIVVPPSPPASPEPSSGPSIARLQQAELALKVEERKVKLDAAKGKLIDRAKAKALVRRLAQEERDAILNWPARAAPVMAAELGVDPHRLQTLLDEHLRAHLADRAQEAVDL
ncbi:MAG: hypothetical protein N2690_02490 [Rhodocyclaceae bacterium]|nr:hypothetical protein [Rhodocyclaceae bacterium]